MKWLHIEMVIVDYEYRILGEKREERRQKREILM